MCHLPGEARVNLKEGAYMPRVSHEQGEIVYMDQFLQIFVDNDGWIFIIRHGGPPQAKNAKEVSSTVLNRWIKGEGHTQNLP